MLYHICGMIGREGHIENSFEEAYNPKVPLYVPQPFYKIERQK